MKSLTDFIKDSLLPQQEPVHVSLINSSTGHAGYTHDFCDIFNQFFKTEDRFMLYARLKTFAENGQCTYINYDEWYNGENSNIIFGILVTIKNNVTYISYPIDGEYKIWELNNDNKFVVSNIDRLTYQRLNKEHIENAELAIDTQYVCIVDFDIFMLQNN